MCNNIYATGGTIGNWVIKNGANNKGLWSDDNKIYIGPSMSSDVAGSGTKNFTIIAGNNFGVQTDGTIWASGAHISGTLTAGTKSKIGGWSINDTNLLASTYGFVGLYTNYPNKVKIGNSASKDDWRIVAGGSSSGGHNFGVDKSGNVYCANLNAASGNFTGVITASANSKIGDWTIENGALKYDDYASVKNGEKAQYIRLTGKYLYCAWEIKGSDNTGAGNTGSRTIYWHELAEFLKNNNIGSNSTYPSWGR